MMRPEIDVRRLSCVPHEALALHEALHLKNPRNQRLFQLSDEQWHRLLRLSDLAHLTLPLALRNKDGFPAWVQERLKKNIDDNKARFNRVKNTYAEAADTLGKAHIEHIVIKGFTLAPDYVNLPWARQQSDLDFYCGRGGTEKAQAALVAIGYQPDRTLNYSAADHSPTLLRLGDWEWQGNAFDPEMPLSIELHFCLWNKRVSLLPLPEVDDFFNRRERRNIYGVQVPVLNPVDQLGHISIHIMRNLLAHDSVLHHLFELASFLDRSADNDDFWMQWHEQHSDSLRSKEVLAFDLAHQIFGCDLSETARAQIDRLPEEQQVWLEEFGHVPLEVPFRENRDAVWLHWSLIQETGQRMRLLRRSFLPNRLPNPDFPALVLSRREIRPKKGHRFLQWISYCWRRLIPYLHLHVRTLNHGALWVARSSNAFYER